GSLDGGVQGETITLSLEEASQIILQQGGLEGAVQLSDGTYQILGQQLIQVTREDGSVDTQALPVEVVQALSGGLMGFANMETTQEQAVQGEDDTDPTSLEAPQVEMADHTHAETAEASEGSQESAVKSVSETVVTESQMNDGSGLTTPMDNSSSQVSEDGQPSALKVSLSAIDQGDAAQQQVVVKEEPTEAKPVEPKPDFNCPIEVTERTEIMIKGKKCVLMQNPETKQLCAYPILPPEGKRRRGRPRKSRPENPVEVRVAMRDTVSENLLASGNNSSAESPASGETKDTSASDSLNTSTTSVGNGDQNSAAESLLELSNAGPDSVRRSGRKRKKAKVFDDYDVLEASSDDEPEGQNDDEKDPEVTMYGIKKRQIKRELPQLASPFMMPVKRGRGRPRRYPPPGQTTTPSSIPAVILPGANGQTLVMAPLQGLQNLPGFQTQVKTQLQQLVAKPGPTPIEPNLPPPTTTISLGPDGDALPLDPTAVLDSSSILTTSLQGESLPLGGESSDTQEGLESAGEKDRSDGDTSAGGDGQQPTVIQIPDNLLPMFGIKKDPIKIGLKARESELEKLKCPKCDFQGYYVQQYQDHIASHAGDIHKCKCCNFLTFNKDDLLQHFKANHPRCICEVCDFMAEHAYMIKRHMMRHNAEGCTCEMCGKVYKDQYILKMHVKMVHMPAEVLFECTVCGKKFTRKAHLKRHLRIHDPEKPFKCPHCDYRGCERSDISKHLLIHEDPKHVCEVCGKAFRHIKNKELHVKRHNGQRDYKCGVCDFYGYTFTDIRKHIERKHSDIKTLVCEKCAMPFKSELQLREHQKDNCEVLMIEQALAIATSSGGTSQATIQIPSTFAVDGQQITIDGQQIAVDGGGQVNITVEQVSAIDHLIEEECGHKRVCGRPQPDPVFPVQRADQTRGSDHSPNYPLSNPTDLSDDHEWLLTPAVGQCLQRSCPRPSVQLEEDTLSEDQMVEATIADVTSSGHVMDSDNPAIADGTIQIIPNDDIEEVVDLPHETMVSLG
ncbi:hypothetical protein BaRGS_00016694, partial [Batillaria attramentaria]